MKNFILSAIVLIFAFALSIHAQNYQQLENLAVDLDKHADKLVDRTSDDIKKGNTITESEIERAFMAEQLSACTNLFMRLVGDKYGISELRSAGRVLVDMSARMPTAGSYISDWNKAKDSINSLNRELRSGQTAVLPPTGNPGNILGRVFWTGMVDATVHLVIRGSNVTTRTVLGTTYPDGLPSFTKILPTSGNITVGVNKKNGRGDVRVIQQPDTTNNYTAIVEIHDEGGGAKSYTVEVFWF